MSNNMEIERKFLVNSNHPDFLHILKTVKPFMIAQGYLNTDPTKTVRVRIRDTEGFLTIKGKQVGIAKPEFEYVIPLADAQAMLALCDAKVIKERYVVKMGQSQWEIDVFKEGNEGLVIAEIELDSESAKFNQPTFLKEEVSTDFKYSNSYLAMHPFKN